MIKKLNGLYRFLPVQLLLLHFRKYQLLLLFWLILLATLTDHFAEHFGASSLFLAPEYLGHINFGSMFLLGSAMTIFIMAWNITTFIIHSCRIPFLGATRQAFLKYCINNALIPVSFLVFYSVMSVRFQWHYEHADALKILRLQLGFYLGFLAIALVSFLYFFRVDRDLLKVILSKITNPSWIREIVPYDSLDEEFDIVKADTYFTESLKIKNIRDLESYPPRLMSTVLRRHHRNALTATIFALALLLLLGVFMDRPWLRIPAASGFLILFSVLMGLVGSMKYFLKTWELMGWVIIGIVISFMVKYGIFDLRSRAFGIDYRSPAAQRPAYTYDHLRALFSPARYHTDKLLGERRLENWKARALQADTGKPPLIIVSVSGGGSRSAYWSFRTLQYLDSISNGRLFSNTVLVTGASGGMIGASYWRTLHAKAQLGQVKDVYSRKYQENMGKDLLNAVIFSFVSVDLISPLNKISIAGYSYTKDRGYAMEQELIRNTDGALDQKLGDFRAAEASGAIPAMVVNATIINDARRLMISAQPVSYLTQPAYALRDSFNPPIDAVDFAALFAKQNPYNLRLTTALRMNATFPFILPVVRLPSQPQMNIMDAGLRDNFGMEVASRYFYVFRDWIRQNAGNVIFIEIRDTREYAVFPFSEQKSLGSMMADPLFVVENKWEPFQSYIQSNLKDVMSLDNDQVHFLSFQYIPEENEKSAALNFRITQREKKDIYRSIDNPVNQAAAAKFLQLLH